MESIQRRRKVKEIRRRRELHNVGLSEQQEEEQERHWQRSSSPATTVSSACTAGFALPSSSPSPPASPYPSPGGRGGSRSGRARVSSKEGSSSAATPRSNGGPQPPRQQRVAPAAGDEQQQRRQHRPYRHHQPPQEQQPQERQSRQKRREGGEREGERGSRRRRATATATVSPSPRSPSPSSSSSSAPRAVAPRPFEEPAQQKQQHGKQFRGEGNDVSPPPTSSSLEPETTPLTMVGALGGGGSRMSSSSSSGGGEGGSGMKDDEASARQAGAQRRQEQRQQQQQRQQILRTPQRSHLSNGGRKEGTISEDQKPRPQQPQRGSAGHRRRPSWGRSESDSALLVLVNNGSAGQSWQQQRQRDQHLPEPSQQRQQQSAQSRWQRPGPRRWASEPRLHPAAESDDGKKSGSGGGDEPVRAGHRRQLSSFSRSSMSAGGGGSGSDSSGSDLLPLVGLTTCPSWQLDGGQHHHHHQQQQQQQQHQHQPRSQPPPVVVARAGTVADWGHASLSFSLSPATPPCSLTADDGTDGGGGCCRGNHGKATTPPPPPPPPHIPSPNSSVSAAAIVIGGGDAVVVTPETTAGGAGAGTLRMRYNGRPTTEPKKGHHHRRTSSSSGRIGIIAAAANCTSSSSSSTTTSSREGDGGKDGHGGESGGGGRGGVFRRRRRRLKSGGGDGWSSSPPSSSGGSSSFRPDAGSCVGGPSPSPSPLPRPHVATPNGGAPKAEESGKPGEEGLSFVTTPRRAETGISTDSGSRSGREKDIAGLNVLSLLAFESPSSSTTIRGDVSNGGADDDDDAGGGGSGGGGSNNARGGGGTPVGTFLRGLLSGLSPSPSPNRSPWADAAAWSCGNDDRTGSEEGRMDNANDDDGSEDERQQRRVGASQAMAVAKAERRGEGKPVKGIDLAPRYTDLPKMGGIGRRGGQMMISSSGRSSVVLPRRSSSRDPPLPVTPILDEGIPPTPTAPTNGAGNPPLRKREDSLVAEAAAAAAADRTRDVIGYAVPSGDGSSFDLLSRSTVDSSESAIVAGSDDGTPRAGNDGADGADHPLPEFVDNRGALQDVDCAAGTTCDGLRTDGYDDDDDNAPPHDDNDDHNRPDEERRSSDEDDDRSDSLPGIMRCSGSTFDSLNNTSNVTDGWDNGKADRPLKKERWRQEEFKKQQLQQHQQPPPRAPGPPKLLPSPLEGVRRQTSAGNNSILFSDQSSYLSSSSSDDDLLDSESSTFDGNDATEAVASPASEIRQVIVRTSPSGSNDDGDVSASDGVSSLGDEVSTDGSSVDAGLVDTPRRRILGDGDFVGSDDDGGAGDDFSSTGAPRRRIDSFALREHDKLFEAGVASRNECLAGNFDNKRNGGDECPILPVTADDGTDRRKAMSRSSGFLFGSTRVEYEPSEMDYSLSQPSSGGDKSPMHKRSYSYASVTTVTSFIDGLSFVDSPFVAERGVIPDSHDGYDKGAERPKQSHRLSPGRGSRGIDGSISFGNLSPIIPLRRLSPRRTGVRHHRRHQSEGLLDTRLGKKHSPNLDKLGIDLPEHGSCDAPSDSTTVPPVSPLRRPAGKHTHRRHRSEGILNVSQNRKAERLLARIAPSTTLSQGPDRRKHRRHQSEGILSVSQNLETEITGEGCSKTLSQGRDHRRSASYGCGSLDNSLSIILENENEALDSRRTMRKDAGGDARSDVHEAPNEGRAEEHKEAFPISGNHHHFLHDICTDRQIWMLFAEGSIFGTAFTLLLVEFFPYFATIANQRRTILFSLMALSLLAGPLWREALSVKVQVKFSLPVLRNMFIVLLVATYFWHAVEDKEVVPESGNTDGAAAGNGEHSVANEDFDTVTQNVVSSE